MVSKSFNRSSSAKVHDSGNFVPVNCIEKCRRLFNFPIFDKDSLFLERSMPDKSSCSELRSVSFGQHSFSGDVSLMPVPLKDKSKLERRMHFFSTVKAWISRTCVLLRSIFRLSSEVRSSSFAKLLMSENAFMLKSRTNLRRDVNSSRLAKAETSESSMLLNFSSNSATVLGCCTVVKPLMSVKTCELISIWRRPRLRSLLNF
mmetsp:Transcript_87601/g.155364  ORF Transcript_87601/g.155364 Transcript_87601/m.155364 type:complete len:203 (-) Transcript_87601:5-613(-)